MTKGFSVQTALLIEGGLDSGVEVKYTYNKTLSSEMIKKTYTNYMFNFIYNEVEYDLISGEERSTIGLTWNGSYGIGLILNYGIKIPLYKN